MIEESEAICEMDVPRSRFPFCIVWCPIPLLTWIFPFIGHMGIGTSRGVIRDFAGPYFVSEDDFAFGRPTKYWQLDPDKATDGVRGWDEGIEKASIVYCKRMHNLLLDNCHSHVATALNYMKYDGHANHSMVRLFFRFTFHAKYISLWSWFKTWMPFLILVSLITALVVYSKLAASNV